MLSLAAEVGWPPLLLLSGFTHSFVHPLIQASTPPLASVGEALSRGSFIKWLPRACQQMRFCPSKVSSLKFLRH